MGSLDASERRREGWRFIPQDLTSRPVNSCPKVALALGGWVGGGVGEWGRRGGGEAGRRGGRKRERARGSEKETERGGGIH